MRNVLMCSWVVLLIIISGCGAKNPEAEAAAADAAEAWLALVDNEQYEESWAETARIFRGAVSKEKWVDTMQSLRKPLGKNISREARSLRYRTTLPGAPDGEYVVIQYRASFENKKSAVETITPMRDADGTWRVSGYFMK